MTIQGKRLAIIGASYLQLPLVLKAKEMGVHSICFAWAEGAVCKELADEFYPISITEKERILDICREREIDGVTTIATDVAVPTVCYIAQELGLIGNSVQSGVLSTNKYAMRKALVASGVHCPQFVKVSDMASALNMTTRMNYPLIVKPCDRSGSIGVCRVNSYDELGVAVEEALRVSLYHEAIIEDFIQDSEEISIEGISWNNEYYVLAVTDKLTTGAPHYVELAHHQPSRHSDAQIKEAIRQAKLSVRALGIQYGASHSELMLTQDGRVHVTEIGARMGGDFIGSDLVYLSTGYDFLAGVIEIAMGRFTPPVKRCAQCAGVWFYSNQTQTVKCFIDQKAVYPQIVKAELTGGALRELTKSSDRGGYFIYQADKRMEIQ
jgi:biotin carboxylase